MFRYWRRRRTATKSFNVILLDGTSVSLQLEGRCTGEELIRRALESQRILSNQEIFGLTTLSDSGSRRWLYLNKSLKKQMSGHSPYTVHLCVWMYPKDHHSLLQSATRHHLYLQVKKDLFQNRLKVANDLLTQTLAGFIVQREIGDFDQHSHGNTYLHEINILPNITSSMEHSITQQHRVNRGCPPRDCEEQVLNIAQGEFTYGTHSYTVQDSQSRRSTLELSICPVGIRIGDANTPITYEWDVIERIRHKGKILVLDLYFNAKSPPPNGPTQFTCGSSHLSSNLAYWCSLLKDFHSDGEVQHAKSRLKRFFSSRRSMRRPPLVSVVQDNRRASTVGDERRSSLGSELHCTALTSTSRISISSPSSNSESKGLVVYGASGLASLRNHTHNHTPNHNVVAEVIVHDETAVRAKSEEPRRSRDSNHFKNHVSHDSTSPSHDTRSHDQLSYDLDHSQRSQGIYPKTSNDQNYESHDTQSRSRDIQSRSHDTQSRSHATEKLPSRRSSEPTSSYKVSRESMNENSPHRRTSALSPSRDSHMYKRYELGPPSNRRSSREHTPMSPVHDSHVTNHYDNHRSPERTSHHRVLRSSREESPKSSSLTRQAYTGYTLAEDSEWEGHNEVINEGATQNFTRVIDPAAKPKNRIRLSLPESSFYDSQGRRGTRLSMSGRRSRNTTISTTTTSLSQPMDSNVWGLNSSKLGSIASLDTQASLAELSQAESLSFIDAHMRSFVFQASQPDTATEL